MNAVQKVAEILRTHKIRQPEYGQRTECAGCQWVGWNHTMHVAQTIVEVLK